MTSTLSIKNVDESVFREIKAEAVKEGVPVGILANRAFSEYIIRHRHHPKRSILDFKPFTGGKGTEHVSEEVDEILYGDSH